MLTDMIDHVHFIGVGGTGLSAMAIVLLEKGYTVSGSDRVLSPLALRVRHAGGQVFSGHRPEYISGADIVVRSSAIAEDNPEVQAARAAGIPVMKRSEFLPQLMVGQRCIAIAGTHGKTTTTAMVAWMLNNLGLDPSFIIGAVSYDLGANARAGKGEYFVVEADEYDRMFLGLAPDVAVVTNIEYDHPDYFKTQEEGFQAFLEFANRLKEDGILIACSDDPGSSRLLKAAATSGKAAVSYGMLAAESGYRLVGVSQGTGGSQSIVVLIQGKQHGLRLQIPGAHNALNALAALAVADQLGLPLYPAMLALEQYSGTERRFQVHPSAAGITVIDDYAHHPTEIRATLAAARGRYSAQEIWAVWQPHTFSRTRALEPEFVSAFGEADHLLVTEIYAAREALPADGYSAKNVVARIDHADVHFVPTLDEATDYLLTKLKPRAVVIVLSAGDADQISKNILSRLEQSATDPGLNEPAQLCC
jgi:UDP-N-acetylmuramate--alanine ligase